MLSLGLFVLCLLLGFATIADYGMGWDEVTRWKSGDAKVEYYEKLMGAEDRLSVVQGVGSDAYPGLFDMTLSILHKTTGWDRMQLGHWQAFAFGLIGVGALWRIGQIFGGARLGFWSVVLLLIVPSFYGHWFHNPKDIPFAAMYTLGLWAMIECLRTYPRVRKRWVLAVAVSCGLCMATRIAGLVLLAYFAAGVGVVIGLYLWEKRGEVSWRKRLRGVGPWLFALPCVGLGAYLTMLPWWPAAHKNLLSVSGATLQRLHVSASEIPLFFRGELMWAADAPFYYTLWMFLIKAPEVLLIGLFLGVLGLGLRLRSGFPRGEDLRRIPPGLILILGGAFPLLYLTVTAPALHNGARHFLFAFPALCLCAAWGYGRIDNWISRKRPPLRRIGLAAFAVLLLLPIWHLVQLHPYQYIYFNRLAGGPAGAYGHYESEYWFTSSKHAVEQLDAMLRNQSSGTGENPPVRLFILGPWQVAEPFLPEGYRLTARASEADFLILNTQMGMHNRYEGEPVFRIERMGLPVCVVRRAPGATPR
jgi:hypothetical protein